MNYSRQAEAFTQIINEYKKTTNNSLLDVCCGTGKHAGLLREKGFDVTGLDLSDEMLSVARKNNPGIVFVQGDMKTFQLDKRFGTILCFFNSMLYNRDAKQLDAALSNFFKHVEPGGILVFDAVDKKVVENDKRGEYRYQGSDHQIVFKPLWKLNPQKNVLDLFIDFEVDGNTFHDHHVMGAFSLKEPKAHCQKAGFEVFMLKRNFEFPRDEEALFVCRRP